MNGLVVSELCFASFCCVNFCWLLADVAASRIYSSALVNVFFSGFFYGGGEAFSQQKCREMKPASKDLSGMMTFRDSLL